MLYIPNKGILRTQTNLSSVGSTTPGTAFTPSVGSKGGTVELITSTSFDVFGVRLSFHSYNTGSAARRCAADLLLGAATEEIAIADILCGFTPGLSVGMGKTYLFPLYIPASTRVAIRGQGDSASAMRVSIMLYGGHCVPWWQPFQKCDTYGGTVPDGVAVTEGTNGAEGSWTQITASTTRDHKAIVPSFSANNDISVQTANHSFDVGIGAATEEQIGGPLYFDSNSGEYESGFWPCWPIFHDIPSGTRLVARCSTSSVTADTRGFNLHAFS